MAGPAGTSGSTQANPDNLNNGGNINNSGFVGTGAAGSGVLSTPGGTFASPAPTAGISDAGRAGISADSTTNPGVTSTLENSTVVYTNGAPVNPRGGNISSAANSSGRMINDLGPSYFSNTVNDGSGTVSLGEVAAQFKSMKGTVNARMLTNEDVQKMVANDTGVTVAKNMPPLGPGAAVQGASQTAATQSAGAQSNTQVAQGSSANQQPQPGAAGQQSSSSSSANAGESTNTQTAEGSTTPQINQQQSNDNQGRSRLPATSTFLPLLGLLGIVSGGLGIWFRKFRR
jgi:hypothetical protein